MTVLWITGFEHGVATPVTNGGGLANTVSGSPAVQGTTKRTGSYALQLTSDAATSQYIIKTITTGAVVTVRMYIYFHTLTAANYTLFRLSGTITSMYLAYRTTGTKLAIYDGSTYTDGPTVTTGQWYRIDIKLDGTNKTLDWYVDGNVQTQASFATAGTVSYILLGCGSGTAGFIYCFDDVLVTDSGSDFPIGAGAVVGLSPDGAGTSVPGTGVIQDDGSVDVNDSTNPANVELDDVPLSGSTDYIKQASTGTGNYAEVTFADTAETTIQGAVALLAYMSAATQTNQGACVIVDEDSTVTEVWGNPTTRADYSESSMFYKLAVLPVPAGGWDTAAVSALKARVGYSNDVNPVPYWENLILEVAYTTGAAPATPPSELMMMGVG